MGANQEIVVKLIQTNKNLYAETPKGLVPVRLKAQGGRFVLLRADPAPDPPVILLADNQPG
jgi:hypothetical protein